MILGIENLNVEEKDLLCEIINRSRDGSLIDVTPEILGVYNGSFLQSAITKQEPNLTDDGKRVMVEILKKIEAQ